MRALRMALLLAVVAWAVPGVAQDGASEPLVLRSRRRAEAVPGSGSYEVRERVLRWDPRRTAAVVCDMWDVHWCRGASRRVAEMAPTMDRLLGELRRRGVLIIHAPSATLEHYAGTAPRRRAREAPAAAPPVELVGWCGIDLSREEPLPIDDSDGGCDCRPRCASGSPWTRQIDTLRVAAEDAVSDRGDEVYRLLEQRGVDHVLVMGVHTNMCVLGRPFAIRQLSRVGKEVVLVRDLTDSMYNSRSKPHVDHFRGTERVVEHIEKYWCATVQSSDVLGGEPFRFAADRRSRVVFVVAEDEYEAARTLPEFAAVELERRFGFECRFALGNPAGGIDGLEALEDAELAVIFARRRTLPGAQLARIRAYLDSGRPVVGIRTASHAFQNWLEFDPLVLGGNYQGHHNNKGGDDGATWVWRVAEAGDHPVLGDFPGGELAVHSWLYKVLPLAEDAEPLLLGRVGDRLPHEPVAWTRTYRGARVFYTSLGHPRDFEQGAFRRLLVNGIFWALGRSPPWHPPAVADRGAAEPRQSGGVDR